MRLARLSASFALLALAFPTAHAAGDAPAASATPDPVLAQVIAGDWRTAAQKERDAYRHPLEALTFWGLKPGMTVLEVQPGAAAYWTEILAPYTKRTGGKLYVTGSDLANPDLSEDAKK